MDEWQVRIEQCGDGSFRWRHEPQGGGTPHGSEARFETAEAARTAGQAALVRHHEEQSAKPQTPAHPDDSRLTDSQGELEVEEDPRL